MKNPDIEAKIIALDLDDTLLKSDLTISDYTVSVLQRAAAQGVSIVLCSGRTENAILPYVRRMDIAGLRSGRYIIAQNGATVFDLHARKAIYSRTVESAVLVEAYRAAKDFGFTCEVYDPSTIFAPDDNEWVRVDKNLSKLNLQIVPDFEKFLGTPFPKMVIPGEPEKIQVLQAQLKERFGRKAVVFTSKPYFLEVLPADCGKGEALKFLAEETLRLPQGLTMAFGDSMNDESMIRYAAHGTAMKNALPYIRQIARHVTGGTNDEDGVAHFIENHVLRQPLG